MITYLWINNIKNRHYRPILENSLSCENYPDKKYRLHIAYTFSQELFSFSFRRITASCNSKTLTQYILKNNLYQNDELQ